MIDEKMLAWAMKRRKKMFDEWMKATDLFNQSKAFVSEIQREKPSRKLIRKYRDWKATQPKEKP